MANAKRGRKPKAQPKSDTVKVPTSRPIPPEVLSPFAREIFERVCDQLEALGNLQAYDADAIALYANHYDTWTAALGHINAPGGPHLTQLTSNGFECKSPWLKIAEDSAKVLNSLQQQFGLTPGSRKPAPAKADDPAAKWAGILSLGAG